MKTNLTGINKLVFESMFNHVEEAATASGNAARLGIVGALGAGGAMLAKKVASGAKNLQQLQAAKMQAIGQ